MLLLLPAAALAAPPPNDTPQSAAPLEPYTAENGTPREFQGAADLAEASPDGGVPRCLGRTSFQRTVWFRVPEAPGPQEITVEASGRTLDVVDLAAFVQDEIPPPPPPPPPTPTPTPPPARSSQAPVLTAEPNACVGKGSGGSDASEEPTAGLTLRVPARHPVLVQVGRRGAAGHPDDERALVSLSVETLADAGTPAGDRANQGAPTAKADRSNFVDLSGASVTAEDPAQPACPSLGTVWRKFRPGKAGKRHISVSGGSVNTLTVFRGTRPTGENAVDCVNRETGGSLEMVVPTKRRQNLWIRLGTDRPLDGAEAVLRVSDGTHETVVDGGPGGFDPTPGGPAGGFPDACYSTDIKRARVGGAALRGTAGAFNRLVRFALSLRVRGASICDAEVRLIGPRERVYARGRAIRLKGRSRVRISRLRTFKRGRYRVQVTGVDLFGNRVRVKTSIRGTLR